MATILVTGDTGFVGSALVKELLVDGQRVIGVSRTKKVAKELKELGDYTHIVSSIEDLNEVLVGETIDAYFDLAWAGSMGPKRGDKDLQHQNTVNALKGVELAASLGAKLYLGVGTITELTALAEDAPVGPATTYGLSKNLARLETKKRAQDLDIEHIWVRLGNTYSEEDKSSRFLNSTLEKLWKDEPVSLLTGNQPFDFIHLYDAARAIALIGMVGESGETYYVGNGEVKTIEEFTDIARSIFGSSSDVTSKTAAINLTEENLDNAPLRELGYSPVFTFEQGIRYWKDSKS